MRAAPVRRCGPGARGLRVAARVLAAALVTAAALPGGVAAAQSAGRAPELEDAEPEGPPPEGPPAGCLERARLEVGETRFVACAHGVVLRMERGVVVGVQPVAGEPTDLFLRNGRLWVEVVRREAFPLEGAVLDGELGPRVPPPPWPPVSSPPGAPGQAGPAAPRPDTAPPAAASTAAPTAPPPRAGPPFRPELDEAAPYSVRIAPPRVPGVELAARAMPFLGDGAGGLLAAFSGTVRLRAPVFVRLELDPVAWSSGEAEFGNAHAYALVGYDDPFFEVGFGAGLMRVRIQDFERDADGVGVTLAATMRLGARDGLHLLATTGFAFIEASPRFGMVTGTLQIPLKGGKWLVFRGAGGDPAGVAYGDVGIRLLVRGDRGRGSLFVTPSLGGVVLEDDVRFVSNGGFVLAFGIELRP